MATPAPAAPPEPSLWDEFVAWLRDLFAPSGGGESPAAPPAPEGANLPPCSRLLDLVRAHGRAGGRALFMREIQHEGGRQGFQQGGWVGAIIGGIAGTGAAAKHLAKCEAEIGPEVLQGAADERHASLRTSHDRQHECVESCRDQHPESHWPHLGRQGKPYRDCVHGCRQSGRQERHDIRRQDLGGTGAGDILGTLRP